MKAMDQIQIMLAIKPHIQNQNRKNMTLILEELEIILIVILSLLFQQPKTCQTPTEGGVTFSRFFTLLRLLFVRLPLKCLTSPINLIPVEIEIVFQTKVFLFRGIFFTPNTHTYRVLTTFIDLSGKKLVLFF